MSKIIDFETSKVVQPKPPPNPNILGTMYHLCRNDENGKVVSSEAFNGLEYVKTVCPVCCCDFTIDFYEFCEIVVTGFCFYSTSLFCQECVAKQVKNE